MKIDNWPLDRIMRLPDWCFGRRWWVGDFLTEAGGDAAYFLGEEHLPDKFIIWGLMVCAYSPVCLQSIRLSVRLGDHVPANAADLLTMELLLKGISETNRNYELTVAPNALTWLPCQRQIIESAGRRLTYAAQGDGAILYELNIGLNISALPSEVPDWLISDSGKNLM